METADFSVFFAKKEFPDVPKEPLIKIVPREEWGAVDAKSKEPMTVPVAHVRYNQTNTEMCMNKEECFPLLQKLQKDHMENKGLPDIQYNFMIAGDGLVYEGRGWETKPKIHDKLKNKDYFDVAYIGTFGKEQPNWEQSVTAQRFLRFALQEKYLQEQYGVTHLIEIADYYG